VTKDLSWIVAALGRFWLRFWDFALLIELQTRARVTLRLIMAFALKFGAALVGVGLLSFFTLATALGGLGSCASGSQIIALALGIVGTGIGGAICVVSVPVILFRKYRSRSIGEVATSLTNNR
jgi:hypothetical protein